MRVNPLMSDPNKSLTTDFSGNPATEWDSDDSAWMHCMTAVELFLMMMMGLLDKAVVVQLGHWSYCCLTDRYSVLASVAITAAALVDHSVQSLVVGRWMYSPSLQLDLYRVVVD